MKTLYKNLGLIIFGCLFLFQDMQGQTTTQAEEAFIRDRMTKKGIQQDEIENYFRLRKKWGEERLHLLPATRDEGEERSVTALVNGDFESGNFTGWKGALMVNLTSSGNDCPIGSRLTPPSFVQPGQYPSRFMITAGSGFDPIIGNPLTVVAPNGGNHSVRLGNDSSDAQSDRLMQTFVVTDSTSNFFYRNALVMEDPQHPDCQNPFFIFRIKNSTGGIISERSVIADRSDPFWICSFGCTILYHNWTTEMVDLSGYIGQSVTAEFTIADCSQGGHFGYAYLDDIGGRGGCENQGCVAIDSSATNDGSVYTYPGSSSMVLDLCDESDVVFHGSYVLPQIDNDIGSLQNLRWAIYRNGNSANIANGPITDIDAVNQRFSFTLDFALLQSLLPDGGFDIVTIATYQIRGFTFEKRSSTPGNGLVAGQNNDVTFMTNIAPVPTDFPINFIFDFFFEDGLDTIVSFESPEVCQTTTTEVESFGLDNFSFNIVDGTISTVRIMFNPDSGQVGDHIIHFLAYDDGVPPETTEVNLILRVRGYASISGSKYHDRNGNKIRDNNDEAIFNWTIFLDENNNGLLDIGETGTHTRADGSYEFPSLRPGTYLVREVLQIDWYQSTDNPLPITVAAEDTIRNVDFGNFRCGNISGVKYHDRDANQIRSMNEEGMYNWTIFLDENNNNLLDFGELGTHTDTNGYYVFPCIMPGTYHVREVVELGWSQSTPDPLPLLLNSGQTISGIDFGNYQTASISGMKFHDKNGDGDRTAGEEGLEGWTIFLDDNNNNTLDAGELATVTDSIGYFRFDQFEPGSYMVREVQQSGWKQTTPNPPTIHLASREQRENIMFGNFQLGSINGKKFFDRNGDSLFTSVDSLLNGWTIRIFKGFQFLAEAVTDDSGYYQFNGLEAGTYTIQESLKIGWLQTYPHLLLVNTTTQTYGEHAGNVAYKIILSSGMSVHSQHFGNILDPTGVPANENLPAEFLLEQNYPNPFNPVTTIRYSLPRKSSVVLSLHNLLGQEIDRFVDDVEEAGYKTFRLNAEHLQSGIYFYKLTTEYATQMRKLILLR